MIFVAIIIMIFKAYKQIAISNHHLTRTLTYPLSIRVRYAPSPTGPMHLGGLRTALFNYLFAKKNKGQFIVRIEDTDRSRYVEGSVATIFETLDWLKIEENQSPRKGGNFGPYIQSQRLDIYKNVERSFLKSGYAYPCFCPSQQKPTNKTKNAPSPPYPNTCRSLSFSEVKEKIKNKQPYAIRLKKDVIEPSSLPSTITDLVYGEVPFQPLTEDFIIIKSDGWPTYHFANVIDDWKMGITHVMRGQQWISSLSKHVYVYLLLGVPLPNFVHLPTVRNLEGRKLSKRDGSGNVAGVKDDCEYEAVRSFLGRLGLYHRQVKQPQAPKPKILSKQQKQTPKQTPKKIQPQLFNEFELVENFELSKITKIPPKLDPKLMNNLNKIELRRKWLLRQKVPLYNKYFMTKLYQIIPQAKEYGEQHCVKMLESIIERLNFITDLDTFSYFFRSPIYHEGDCLNNFKKLFGKNSTLTLIDSHYKSQGHDEHLYQKNKQIIHNLLMIIHHIIPPNEFNEKQLSKKISEYLYQKQQLKNEDVYHLLRWILIGARSGPNIADIVGIQEVKRRIDMFTNL